ncbi:MAG: ABC transporter permease, partial [Clostridia bacterium]|nr:ABC transporter permease [Clostridia bacterium]
FSLILAVVVSAINLTIGAIYGAIEGYFGGVVDMTMERISDILSGIPSTVVTILFQLHLAAKVGVVGALLFAFVMTGWIGMASRVRMQFYRFKNQEYVLAARTLGATDWRIIWKHIFPNTLGTLITGSILVIPGVIFSETSLSYLGIINLDSATMSSVGTMLSEGQKVMTTAPHVVLFPAIFIALLMISFNIFGNGLRDAFNPSLRGTED